jgi:nonsense-mediated mRNA decay protein 3
MVCPKCGKDSEIDVFCRDCFLGKNLRVELPTLIEISHCTRCNTYLLSGRELRFGSAEDAIAEVLQRKLRGNIEGIEKQVGEKINRELKIEPLEKRDFTLHLTLSLGDFSMVKRTIVRIKETTCGPCGRASGGYWEALIQLRGSFDKGTVEGIIKGVESSGGKNPFVSRIERLKGGYDLYIGSKKAAEKIVRNFRGRAEVKKSSHLISVDRQTSKSASRFTYLVRM